MGPDRPGLSEDLGQLAETTAAFLPTTNGLDQPTQPITERDDRCARLYPIL